MEFSRKEYWSGLPFPSPEDLPNPGIEPRSPALQAFSLPSGLPGKPGIDSRADEILDRNEKNIILFFSPVREECGRLTGKNHAGGCRLL